MLSLQLTANVAPSSAANSIGKVKTRREVRNFARNKDFRGANTLLGTSFQLTNMTYINSIISNEIVPLATDPSKLFLLEVNLHTCNGALRL